MLRSTSRSRGLRRSAVVVCSAVGLLISVVVAAGPAAASGSTGAAYDWGTGDAGEMGNGTLTGSDVPLKASLPAGVTAIAAAAGYADSLVLTSTGALYSWGEDGWGELGNGTLDANTDVPVKVSLPSGVTATAIAAGYLHDLAVTSTGAVYAWGDNTEGELGNGTTTLSTVPVLVSLPAGVIATAVSAGETNSFALTSTGAIYAWGYNADGQLGDGTTSTIDVPTLVSLPGGVSATAVSAGVDHTLALTSTGAIYAWGNNANGEVGDGTTTNRDVPTLVSLPVGVSAAAVAGGGIHSLAVATTGKVYAWGGNLFGEIGDGTTTDRHTPVLISLPAGVKATAVGGGWYYSLALTPSGSAYAWGGGSSGQLGDGATANTDAPVSVSFPAGVTAAAIAAGLYHALAVTPLAPGVTGVAPSSGSTVGGTLVTVTGKGFTGATQVLFGSAVATGLVVVSDAKLTVVSPAHSVGIRNVRVVTPAGESGVVAAAQFTYKVIAPKVTGVSPTSGPSAGGTPVTVRGSGFTGATEVLFGGTVATGVVVVSDTEVTVTSPAHSAYLVNVRVVTPAGTSGVVAADEFTYRAPPRVTGVSPTSGPAAGGTHVTVTGTGFTGATQVLFGGTVGTIVLVSDTQLTVISPAHSAFAINVRVVTPGGESSVVAADQFTYQSG